MCKKWSGYTRITICGMWFFFVKMCTAFYYIVNYYVFKKFAVHQPNFQKAFQKITRSIIRVSAIAANTDVKIT